MAIINVDDAYILNETGAQVDKTTGIPFKNESLTEAEAAQARANIRAGGSNDNLLDNAYFVGGGSQLGDGVFPINQRGQASYGAGQTIDRWKLSSGGTLVFTNEGISINGLFFQKEVIDFTVGETYTLSRQTTDGNVVSVTGVVPSTEGWMIGDQNFGVYFRPSTKVCDIQIWGTYLLRAVKLEKGTVSTLANDAPPDFGEELRKCQRRLFIHDFANGEIIANGFAVSASYSVLSLTLPVSMASDGTLTGTVTANPLIYGGGTSEQVSSFSVSAVKGNYAKIGVATTVMPSNNAVILYANTNIRLTISKEL